MAVVLLTARAITSERRMSVRAVGIRCSLVSGEVRMILRRRRQSKVACVSRKVRSMDELVVEPITKPFDITFTPPGSKSLTNRAMVLAALTDGPCELRNALFAD